jgi:hypothetical protein
VGFNSLKSLILTNFYPNNKNKKSDKVKSKPLELFELAGKNSAEFDKSSSRNFASYHFSRHMQLPTGCKLGYIQYS